MKRAFVAIIGTALLAVSGYAQSDIGGVRWELTELNGNRVANSRAFIEFDEAAGRFSGNAGCNRMFGSYELEGRRFRAGDVGTTRMACPGDGVARQETAFLEALRSADRLRRNGATLTIRDAGDRILKFQRAKRSEPGQEIELTANKWLLRSVNDKAVRSPNKRALSLIFNAEAGTAGGYAGCNTFGGEYEVNGSEIRFSDILQTLIGCRTEVEKVYLDALRTVSRFEISGDRLALFRGDKEVLVFEGIAK